MVKQAIAEGEFPFVVLVSDETPNENIRRFASSKGCTFDVVEEDGEYKFTFTK